MKNLSLYSVAIISFLLSCSPEEDYLVPVDYNKLTYLIQDNFNLSTFSAGLRRSGYDKALLEDGPFTALVPSDEAFALNGVAVNTMQTSGGAWVNNMMGYHVLEGLYELDKLPFLFNQEILSITGNPVYVTRWVKEQDTLVTVNGVQVYNEQIETNNGHAYILDDMLSASVHNNIVDYIADVEDLTLFSQAVLRSGLDEKFSGEGPYTVFAPNNQAMNDFGFASLQAVNAADPSELAELVRYHVLEDRRFFNDFSLTMELDERGDFQVDYIYSPQVVLSSLALNGYRGRLNARMLDGNRVTFLYAYKMVSGSKRHRLSLIDVAGEETVVHLLDQDFIARNGVVHHVDNVMKHMR